MALTTEQRKRKRERKLERATRPTAAPVLSASPTFGEFVGCWSLFRDRDFGKFHILVARRRSGGQIRTCGFLIDEWALGVKDAWWADGSERGSLRRLEGAPRRDEMTALPPAEALRLLHEAVQAAAGRGFGAHPQFRSAMSIFEGVVAEPAPADPPPDPEEAPVAVAPPPETPPEGIRGFLLRLFGRRQEPGPRTVD